MVDDDNGDGIDGMDAFQIAMNAASSIPGPHQILTGLMSIIPYQLIAKELGKIDLGTPAEKQRRADYAEYLRLKPELEAQTQKFLQDKRQEEVSDYIVNWEKRHGDKSLKEASKTEFNLYPEVEEYYKQVLLQGYKGDVDVNKLRFSKIDNETEREKKFRETLTAGMKNKDPEGILMDIKDLEMAGYTAEDLGQDKKQLETKVSEKYGGTLPDYLMFDNDGKKEKDEEDLPPPSTKKEYPKESLEDDNLPDEYPKPEDFAVEEEEEEEEGGRKNRFDEFMQMMMTFMKGQNTPQKSVNEIQAGDLEYYEIVFDSFTCSDAFTPAYTSSDWPAFKLDNSIGDIVKFNVLEVSIPFTWTLINSTNNIFQMSGISTGPAPTLFGITPGSYTPTTLAVEIQSLLNSYPSIADYFGPFVVTIENGKLNFQSTTASTAGDYFAIDWNFNTNPNAYLGYGFNSSLQTSSIYVVSGDQCLLTSQNIVSTNPTSYYINSQNIGNQINLLLPLNDVSNTSSNMLGPQVAAVPFSNTVIGKSTTWQASASEKWFDLKMRMNGVWDFYVSSDLNPNVPLQFNGTGFTIRLGIMVKPKQNNSSDGYKYVVDSTREGYFKDDSVTGYRDPWDFANDTLEREYLSNPLKRRR